MKLIKMTMPTCFIVISCSFLIASFHLPKANLGNPNGPVYFPVGLSSFLLLFSVIYFIQEVKKLNTKNQTVTLMMSGRTPKLILATVLLGVGYALIFEATGFLLSTVLFLGALLFVVNGIKKWKVNIVVAISFSLLSWYAFNQLLGVSLP